MKIVVDFDICESNGVCMGVVPDVFDLDDDDMLHILEPDVKPEHQDLVREAARRCPRQAITLEE